MKPASMNTLDPSTAVPTYQAPGFSTKTKQSLAYDTANPMRYSSTPNFAASSLSRSNSGTPTKPGGSFDTSTGQSSSTSTPGWTSPTAKSSSGSTLVFRFLKWLSSALASLWRVLTRSR